ncbi:MAG TPA: universal stress protein [Burkholderiaceae bacterium]|nr:universal stress protein [Burkholderiaceae bacterium]
MKILAPVDGSKFSKAAIGFLAARTTLIGAQPDVYLLNVQAPIPPRAARAAGKDIVQAYYEEEAESALRPAAAQLKRAGITAHTKWIIGHAGEKIAAAAVRGEFDLIVMGSHGHGPVAQLLLGSTARQVLAGCTTPLLLLREESASTADALAVGIAVDGSRYGKQAAAYVVAHRQLFGAGARFSLINVVPDFYPNVVPDISGVTIPTFTEEQIATMQQASFEAAIAPIRKLLARAKIEAEEVRLVGHPGEEIAAYAKKKKLDLLVLGSHGYGAFKAVVMGSVAMRVAAHCKTPLLLVREA